MGEPIEGAVLLADLERLALALEAVRTVFSDAAAALADEFGEAAQQLTHMAAAKPGESTLAQRYEEARRRFTEEVRPLIAPSTARWWGLRWRTK